MTNALIDIMSSKPHKIRKRWLKDRAAKIQGVKFDRDSKNFDISKRIDRLNFKIKGL